MELTPTERDRLLLFDAAQLARARRSRGLQLNVPEATAMVADEVAEAARDGLRLTEAVERGRAVLGPDDVLPGVTSVVQRIEVEAVFADGTRLAVVTEPFGPPSPGQPDDPHAGGADATDGAGGASSGAGLAPGAILPADQHAPGHRPGPQPDRDDLVHLEVVNDSPVPISVTSHFHFFEVNPRLRFDRAAAWGTRLSIPAGTVQRFDPGETVPVTLVPIGGERIVIGFAGLVDGPLDAPGARDAALERARACGYLDAPGPGTPRGAAGDGQARG